MPNIEIPSNPTELWIIAAVVVLLISGIFALLTLQQKTQISQEKERTDMMKSLLSGLQKRADDCTQSELKARETVSVLVRENGELRNEVKNKEDLIRKLRSGVADVDKADTDEILVQKGK